MARRPASQPTKYNPDFFRGMGGPGPLAVGIAVLLVILAGFYLAFAKQIPFTSPGYELKATFANAARISDQAPVRIAGVNVGKVTGLERKGNYSVVSFSVDDTGRPIHEDASVEIRPRIFLEGNFFIDLHPGSPSSPELPDNGRIPLGRTATAVQLDQILTSLQKPERASLQRLLEGLGRSLTYQPAPADDLTQDPSVRGESAAKALNDAFDTGPEAGRTTAIVTEALLGTQKDDLRALLVGGSRISAALNSREAQLKDLLTNLNITTGALADEAGNLAGSLRRLPPTLDTAQRSLVDLDAALPPLRGLAITLRPGVAELPATINAGLPWLDQARPLLSQGELGGIASLLERSVPDSASALQQTVAGLPELTNLSRCVDENLVPTGNVVLQDRFGGSDFGTGQPNYRELFYSSVGVAGESENFDGNGIYVRLQPGGGPVKVKLDNPSGTFGSDELFGNTISPPQGTRPRIVGPPPIRSDVACYRNGIPSLNGPAAAAGPPSPRAYAP